MRRKVRSIKALPYEEDPFSYKVKLQALLEQHCCQLPSCRAQKSLEEMSPHYWNFQGKKRHLGILPHDYHLIHLLCRPFCHDRVHKIATVIVLCLEIFPSLRIEDLLHKAMKALDEVPKNVSFVLEEELKPAGIVQIEKGKCELIKKNTKRIDDIKKYLEIHDPRLLWRMERIKNM